MRTVRLIINFIIKLIASIYLTIKKFIYQYKATVFFKRVRKDITKLNWYMVKARYPRHERRRILRKIIDYVDVVNKITPK